MTKIQRLENELEQYRKMTGQINKVFSDLDKSEKHGMFKYPYYIGAIEVIVEIAEQKIAKIRETE